MALMNKAGPDGLSLNAILREANKPRGSFYAAFSGKEAWLAALIQRYFQPPTQALARFADAARRDTLSAWASWNAQRLRHAIHRGDRVVSLTEMAGRCGQSSLAAATCEALFDERTRALSKIVTAAFLVTGPQAGTQARLVLAMLDGVESRASAARTPELVDQFYQFLFKHHS